MAKTRRWAFWSEWSDLTKWVMGIISSLLVATLIGLISFVSSAANREPELEMFANATAELDQAITKIEVVIAETINELLALGKMEKETYSISQEKLAFIWKDRVKLMYVLLGYSDALAGVAASGAKAQQKTEMLGNSIMRLADNAPYTDWELPTDLEVSTDSEVVFSPSTDMARDLAAKQLAEAIERKQPKQILVRTGIQIKAYQNLGQAVGALHPALSEVAKQLEDNLESLRFHYKLVSALMESTLREAYKKLEFQRDELLAKRDRLRESMLETINDPNIVEQVKNIEELIAHMEPEHQEYVLRRNALLQNQTATNHMFNNAQEGIRAWVQVHKELKLVIEQDRRPDVRLISRAAKEINDAVDRIRNQ